LQTLCDKNPSQFHLLGTPRTILTGSKQQQFHFSLRLFTSLHQFGNIVESRLLVDEEGKSHQAAFVEYSCKKEADAGLKSSSSPLLVTRDSRCGLAIGALNGYSLPGERQGLLVKYAVHPNSLEKSSPTSSESYDPPSPPSRDTHESEPHSHNYYPHYQPEPTVAPNLSMYPLQFSSSSSSSSSLGGVPYPVPLAYAYPTPYPHSYPTDNCAETSFMSHSSQLTNGPPLISSAVTFSSRSTTNFESKSQTISTGQTTGPSRLLTSSIGGVGDRLQSFSCPPSGSFQPNTRPLVAVSPPLTTSPAEERPLQPKYLVSLIGISRSHDILSFPFITSLGRVLESNISPLVSSARSSENSSTSSSRNTSPTPSNCSTKEPAINYVIAPKTSSQYAQLHSLNNAILPIDDCHITVRGFSLPLALPHSQL
jgi:hypothetical protein